MSDSLLPSTDQNESIEALQEALKKVKELRTELVILGNSFKVKCNMFSIKNQIFGRFMFFLCKKIFLGKYQLNKNFQDSKFTVFIVTNLRLNKPIFFSKQKTRY